MSDELEHLRLKVDKLEEEKEQLKIALQQYEERCAQVPSVCSNSMATTTLKEEEAQRDSDRQYRLLVENSLQGLAIICDRRIVLCNSAYAKMTGYSIEELMRAPDTKMLVHPDDHAVVFGRYRDRLAGNAVPPNYDHRIIRKDGAERWVEVYACLVEYKGKAAVQVACMDITERRQAESILKESEDQLRLIGETIDEVIWIYDAEAQKLVYVSPAHDRVYGYAKERLYEDIKRFYEPIHPDDKARVIEAVNLMKDGQILNHEFRIVRPDGSIRYIWDRSFPVRDETGKIRRFVGIAQDITDWKRAAQADKESKEFLDKVINCIGDPIFVKDSQHRFVHVNDAMCAFTGLDRDKLVGQTALEHLSEDAVASLLEQEKDTLKTGREWIAEENIPDSQGKIRTIMSKKSLLVDNKGNKQIVGVLRDITEYKRLEAQLFQSQKMEAIGVLAGGVAHDFNNILTVIKGYTEISMRSLDSYNPMRRDLEQIAEAEQKATTLTSQLLAFSRKQILKPELLNLNEIVSDMGRMLRRLIGEDIELLAMTRPDLDLIHADPGQMQQIIMNLAVNARDAMPQGGKLIIETSNAVFSESDAREYPLVDKGPCVMLSVSDTGMGMDEYTQARIFEPFFTTKGKSKGTGLGLSTVYGIVKQSKGSIWVSSEIGKGTTFKICFPRAQRETKPGASGNIGEPRCDGSETVIVVEDDEAVRNITCRMLRDWGYKVLEAADGREALRISEEHDGEIHLLLTDVVMPEMDGKKLADQLKAIQPNLKIIYTSGYTDNAIVHNGELEPDIAFLQKPFTTDSLGRKVREVLDL